MKGSASFIIALVLVAVFTNTSQAVIMQTYSFNCITNNSVESTNIAMSQMFCKVGNPGPGIDGTNRAIFTFQNIGPDACALAEIYFDDGSLLGIASIIENPPLVDFKQDKVRPKNLPGGESANPDFEAIASFSLEPENPEPFYGVNPGEEISVIFNLTGDNATVYNVLNELATGELRIGIHVKAFDNGQSESLINIPILTPIPEPATIMLLGFGVAFLKSAKVK